MDADRHGTERPNHAMERTADRGTAPFGDDFHTATATDARARPPSLILFSLGPKIASPMDQFFDSTSPFWPVLVDFVVAFLAGAYIRRIGLRLVTCVAFPFAVAFLCAGPRNLLTGTGEQHGWALIILAWLFVLGLVGSAVGAIAGWWSWRWSSRRPRS
jgi:hypothetical protein